MKERVADLLDLDIFELQKIAIIKLMRKTIEELWESNRALVTKCDLDTSMKLTWKSLTDKNRALRDILEDMVWQYCSEKGILYHGYMSAGENAFDVLGLENGMNETEMQVALSKDIKNEEISSNDCWKIEAEELALMVLRSDNLDELKEVTRLNYPNLVKSSTICECTELPIVVDENFMCNKCNKTANGKWINV